MFQFHRLVKIFRRKKGRHTYKNNQNCIGNQLVYQIIAKYTYELTDLYYPKKIYITQDQKLNYKMTEY